MGHFQIPPTAIRIRPFGIRSDALSALTDCRDCGKEVSRKAKSCPHCGANKPGEPAVVRALNETGNALIGCGCVLSLLLFLVFGVGMCGI